MDFLTTAYLSDGNTKQQNVFRLLTSHQIFENLAAYNPILVGTIPIDIDTDDSDIDIICHWKERVSYKRKLETLFEEQSNFAVREKLVNGIDTIIANFQIEHFSFEVFGQNKPTQQQDAYRHLIIEHQIIEKFGEHFRRKIRALKADGLKTEPAFAKLLGIEGDPYQGLLNYKLQFKSIIPLEFKWDVYLF